MKIESSLKKELEKNGIKTIEIDGFPLTEDEMVIITEKADFLWLIKSNDCLVYGMNQNEELEEKLNEDDKVLVYEFIADNVKGKVLLFKEIKTFPFN